MSKTVTATARAVVTLEVLDLGSWGDGTMLDQVYRQASEEAREKILRCIQDRSHGKIRIVGEPKITAVLAERGE